MYGKRYWISRFWQELQVPELYRYAVYPRYRSKTTVLYGGLNLGRFRQTMQVLYRKF